jgi:hypothetical protein
MDPVRDRSSVDAKKAICMHEPGIPKRHAETGGRVLRELQQIVEHCHPQDN